MVFEIQGEPRDISPEDAEKYLRELGKQSTERLQKDAKRSKIRTYTALSLSALATIGLISYATLNNFKKTTKTENSLPETIEARIQQTHKPEILENPLFTELYNGGKKTFKSNSKSELEQAVTNFEKAIKIATTENTYDPNAGISEERYIDVLYSQANTSKRKDQSTGSRISKETIDLYNNTLNQIESLNTKDNLKDNIYLSLGEAHLSRDETIEGFKAYTQGYIETQDPIFIKKLGSYWRWEVNDSKMDLSRITQYITNELSSEQKKSFHNGIQSYLTQNQFDQRQKVRLETIRDNI